MNTKPQTQPRETSLVGSLLVTIIMAIGLLIYGIAYALWAIVSWAMETITSLVS